MHHLNPFNIANKFINTLSRLHFGYNMHVKYANYVEIRILFQWKEVLGLMEFDKEMWKRYM